MFVEPSEPLASPLGSILELLKNGSSSQPSSVGTSFPSCRASIATMMFSPTPLRLSWIMRSDERSKLGGRDAMIRMIVFSLKPALTCFTSSAVVSGPSFLRSCACAAVAQPASKQKAMNVVGKKDFIAHPLSVPDPARRFLNLAAGPSVHSVFQSS